jgi:cell wall-associated NlpC family hydrolase
MTKAALHPPRATTRRHRSVTLGLSWLAVGAVVSVALAGGQHPAVAMPAAQRAAVVTVADPVATDIPPTESMNRANLPGSVTESVLLQPIPAFVRADDPPGLGPAPAVDPAVALLLASLREDAKGSPDVIRPGDQALVAVNFALSQVGIPYVWGATGPLAYDCSGLTWRSYDTAGVTLPRVSADQYALGGTPVAIPDLLPGDLVFFATAAWDPGAVHHVGMYVGHGLMVDAPHPGAYVRVEPVWAAGYVGAVRVVPERPASDPVAPGTPALPVIPVPAVPTVPATPDPTATPTPAPSPTPTPTPSDSPTPADPPPSDPPSDPPADPPPSDPPPADTPSPSPSPSQEASPPATDPPADPSATPASSPDSTDPAADPDSGTPGG